MVVGHGTTSTAGIYQLVNVVDQLRAEVGVPVGYGFIELAKPGIKEGLSALLESGDISTVLMLPLLLLAAGHVKSDVPNAVWAARDAFPEVAFHSARELGIAGSLLDIVEQRTLSPFELISDPNPGTNTDFTLLVGRGSTDPDANSDLYKIARLLTERSAIGQVEPAFVSLATPHVPEGLDRVVRLGANAITVTPYFLFTGTLLERIYTQSRAWGMDNPDVSLRLAREIGPDRRITQLLLERADEIRSSVPQLGYD